MNTANVNRALVSAAIFVLLLLAVTVLLTLGGCRKKSNPYIPPDTNAGHWALVLHGPRVMYRDHPGGHVPNNDSIYVRVYDPNGLLHGGVLVHSQCDVSRDSIALLVTTRTDTTVDWRGCDPHLTYWGSGGADGTELVKSYIIAEQETIRAAIGFKVLNPP